MNNIAAEKCLEPFIALDCWRAGIQYISSCFCNSIEMSKQFPSDDATAQQCVWSVGEPLSLHSLAGFLYPQPFLSLLLIRISHEVS